MIHSQLIERAHESGIWHLEITQRLERPLKDRYICCVIDLDATLLAAPPEDEPILVPGESNHLRIIVCMGWEGSDRLRRCQYVQSDIGFKRIVGFYEFELAGWERDAYTCAFFLSVNSILFRITKIHRLMQASVSICKTYPGHSLERWIFTNRGVH